MNIIFLETLNFLETFIHCYTDRYIVMSMTYKRAHYDGLDGKNGDDEAGITRLLFLVSFSLNLMKIIPEREKFF